MRATYCFGKHKYGGMRILHREHKSHPTMSKIERTIFSTYLKFWERWLHSPILFFMAFNGGIKLSTCMINTLISFWANTSSTNVKRLQIVQNFAARIISSKHKFKHITPFLKNLKWLPVEDQMKIMHWLLMLKRNGT